MSDPTPTTIDSDQLRRSLSHAWGTEVLLAISGMYASDDEIIRLANNWAAVQTYYILYHATQALAIAKGFPRPVSHPKTQNLFASFWNTRPLSLSPWTLGVDATGFLNLPAAASIELSLHPWKTCNVATQLSHVGNSYRSTRDEHLGDALRAGRENKRSAVKKAWKLEEDNRISRGIRARTPPTFPLPRLTSSEKITIDSRVGPIGLIHYMYRLRIKTNYVDTSMFADGPNEKVESEIVHRDLRYIAASTLLLHELHLSELVGPATFNNWVDDWLASNSAPGLTPFGLAQRRHLL